VVIIVSNQKLGPERSYVGQNAITSYDPSTKRFVAEQRTLHLFKVKVRIEEVLRGKIDSPEIDIFYYTYLGPIGGVPGLGLVHFGGVWRLGDREIFYLKRVGNLFRPGCELNAGCVTPVFSGAHPGFSFGVSKPATDSIIDLILTRGEGSTDQGMIKAIHDRSAERIDQSYTILKWHELAERDQSKIVRDAACSRLLDWDISCPTSNRKLP
jgi:hypothetical protein